MNSASSHPGMQHRGPRLPLYIRVILGVILGGMLGWLFGNEPYFFGCRNQDLGAIGQLVIRILKALAAPLIFFAILDSFAKTRISGGQGARLLLICIFNVSVAFSIGLTIMNVWQPGTAWRESYPQVPSDAARPDKTPEGVTLSPFTNLLRWFPDSLAEPFNSNNVIALVILGVLLGAALRAVRTQQSLQAGTEPLAISTVERFVESVYQMLMQCLMWVVQLVPLAVFASMASTVGQHGLGVLGGLWIFLVTMLAGLLLHALGYYTLMAWWIGRKPPRVYLGQGADAIITGLSINSSLATVPVTLKRLASMGVSERSARLSACIGTNLNNDGVMLYEAMAAIFLAQASGLDLTFTQQLGVALASVMAGVGIAGIPEAGLIVLPLVLANAGLSDAAIAAAIPLIMPVDWIIARVRSAVNVMSDMLVAILLDRLEFPTRPP